MRIIHLLAPATFGGLERVVQSLAIEQSRAGHDVHVAVIVEPGSTQHPLLRAVRERGVSAHELHSGGRSYMRERRQVRELLQHVRPDIVHTHGYRTDVLHSQVARALHIATAATAHGFTWGDWKNRIYEGLQRRAYRRVDGVIAVSRPLHDMLARARVPGHRLHLIPNAWADPTAFLDRDEARRALGVDENAWCAGFIGRLGHEKGPDTFIDAFALAARAHPQPAMQAVVIGDGSMRDALASRSAQLGAAVMFAGIIENAARLIRAFDVIVLSSRTEGTPMVLLEAMAAGVPVVATRVGGVPDVVSEHEAMLSPADDPASLAVAIGAVASDPRAAAVRARNALSRIDTQFGADQWRERHDAVYRACIAARSIR